MRRFRQFGIKCKSELCVLIAALSWLALAGCTHSRRGNIVDVRDFPSPDGKYVCTMFGEIFYDTTGYPRHIDLRRTGEKWRYPGNIYIVQVGDDAEVSWSSPTNLSIALHFESTRKLPANTNLAEVAIIFSEISR